MLNRTLRILIAVLFMTLFVQTYSTFAKKPPKKPDIAQEFMDFLSDNVGQTFDVKSSTTFNNILSRITLNLDGQITSPTGGVITNASVKSANGQIEFSDPNPRNVSIKRLNANIIEFQSVPPQLIVVQVFLTAKTANKKKTVFQFKKANVTIIGFPLEAVGGKITFSANPANPANADRQVVTNVDPKGKTATMWAKLKLK